MIMKQVLVDMDGVLANVYAHLKDYEYKLTGIIPTEEEMHGRLEEYAFPSFQKIVRSKGFFRTAPLIEGSVKGLQYLNNNYKVLIVSSATEFPTSLSDKQAWLNEFFPFISWRQMIFCGNKDSIYGDIMINDHAKNLRFFEGRRILFTQPHNVYLHDNSFERVSSWREIIGKL